MIFILFLIAHQILAPILKTHFKRCIQNAFNLHMVMYVFRNYRYNEAPGDPLTIVHLVAECAEVEGEPGDREHRQHDNERGRHQDNGEAFDAAPLRRRGHGGGRQIARVPPQSPAPVVLRCTAIMTAHAVIRGVRVLVHVRVRRTQGRPPAHRVTAAPVRCVISAL